MSPANFIKIYFEGLPKISLIKLKKIYFYLLPRTMPIFRCHYSSFRSFHCSIWMVGRWRMLNRGDFPLHSVTMSNFWVLVFINFCSEHSKYLVFKNNLEASFWTKSSCLSTSLSVKFPAQLNVTVTRTSSSRIGDPGLSDTEKYSTSLYMRNMSYQDNLF